MEAGIFAIIVAGIAIIPGIMAARSSRRTENQLSGNGHGTMLEMVEHMLLGLDDLAERMSRVEKTSLESDERLDKMSLVLLDHLGRSHL